jgi:uncharacterized membrane protein YhaH (DUF805 family)/RNA polymerase subunit RPABC4/transcription elongation factor Spt4
MSEEREKKADEVFCFACGEAIKQEAEICPKCGIRQKPYSQRPMAGRTEIYCQSCGGHIRVEAEICPKCGVRQKPAATAPRPLNTSFGGGPNAGTGTNVAAIPPIRYFVTALEKYVVFIGRARRAEYWWFLLAIGIINGVFHAICRGIFYTTYDPGVLMVPNIISLAFFLPSLSVGWRRMHDVGKPGGYIFIPIYSIILAATAGMVGENQYGPDPKEIS